MREIVDEEEKKEVMQQLFHEVRESKIDVVQRAKEIIQKCYHDLAAIDDPEHRPNSILDARFLVAFAGEHLQCERENAELKRQLEERRR